MQIKYLQNQHLLIVRNRKLSSHNKSYFNHLSTSPLRGYVCVARVSIYFCFDMCGLMIISQKTKIQNMVGWWVHVTCEIILVLSFLYLIKNQFMHKEQTSQLKNLICFDAIHVTFKIFRVGFTGKIMLQLCYGTTVVFSH